jgi:mRNA interferase RelE/StbE
VIYKVGIPDVCLSLIERISDKNIQLKIIDRIDALRSDPEKKGKILAQKLAGFRSMHAAGRYRVVYRIDEDSRKVWVLAAGLRKGGDQKDIYKIAKKLLKLGLLDYKI